MVRAAETTCVDGDDVVSTTSNTRGSMGGIEPAARPATEIGALAAPPVSVLVTGLTRLAVVAVLTLVVGACTSTGDSALDDGPEVAGVLTTRDRNPADVDETSPSETVESSPGRAAESVEHDRRLVDALPTLDELHDGAVAHYEAMHHVTDPRRLGDLVIEPCGEPLTEAMAIDARTSAFSGGSAWIDEVIVVARLVGDDAPLLTGLVAAEGCDGATVETVMGLSHVEMLDVPVSAGRAVATGWAWYPAGDSTRDHSTLFYVFDAPPLDGWLMLTGPDGDETARAALVDRARPIVDAFADRLAECAADLEVCAAS